MGLAPFGFPARRTRSSRIPPMDSVLPLWLMTTARMLPTRPSRAMGSVARRLNSARTLSGIDLLTTRFSRTAFGYRYP